MWAEVESLLIERDWSPQRISRRLLAEQGVRVSHESIYGHLLQDKRNGGGLFRQQHGAKALAAGIFGLPLNAKAVPYFGITFHVFSSAPFVVRTPSLDACCAAHGNPSKTMNCGAIRGRHPTFGRSPCLAALPMAPWRCWRGAAVTPPPSCSAWASAPAAPATGCPRRPAGAWRGRAAWPASCRPSR